jgi:asparagine synthase (glutamine-hydrolysing)
MPGMVGIITKMPRQRVEPQLLRMVQALKHESFYRTGVWIDETLGVYVGWTAIRNSFADGMPLHEEGTESTLIFSGEEYSSRDGVPVCRGEDDSSSGKEASYLLEIAAKNSTFPASLNGLFHGLLANRIQGTVRLFNDRYGMHRLYYHESEEAFYFATEAKAILEIHPELRMPSLQGLGEFLTCSCVLENRTIFKDIFVLPAASSWVFQDAKLQRKGTYFEPRVWEEQDPLDAESYYQELQSQLSRILPSYFAGPERVGVALTGGMDTRVLMAQHASAAGELPCYTFGGTYRDCQDVRLAREVASTCQQGHQVIPVGDEFLKHFPHYAERSVYLTEGAVDVYRSSDLYVSEKARAIAPVKVVGTYGSEIVRHAVMFKPMPPADGVLHPDFTPHLRHAEETYAAIRRSHPVTFAAFRQSPWYHHGILALEQTQLTVRSPYLDNNFVRTVYRSPRSTKLTEDVRQRLIKDGSAPLARIPSDRGVGGSYGRLTSAIARNFLEFTFKAEYAYDYGMPQWVAKVDHLLAPLRLERLFLGRHKFLHYRVWYRDALASYVREMLLDQRTLSRPYVNRKNMETMVAGHLKGNRNYTTAIHKMLTLELLQRLFFDPQ